MRVEAADVRLTTSVRVAIVSALLRPQQTCRKQWSRPMRAAAGKATMLRRVQHRRVEDQRVREAVKHRMYMEELTVFRRYRLSATAIKSMATYTHTQDCPASILRDWNHLCADRRSADIRQLEGEGDQHRLLEMRDEGADMPDDEPNTQRQHRDAFQEPHRSRRCTNMVQKQDGR